MLATLVLSDLCTHLIHYYLLDFSQIYLFFRRSKDSKNCLRYFVDPLTPLFCGVSSFGLLELHIFLTGRRRFCAGQERLHEEENCTGVRCGFGLERARSGNCGVYFKGDACVVAWAHKRRGVNALDPESTCQRKHLLCG